MANRVVLPRLKRFKLIGFQHLFHTDVVDLQMSDGPYIALGGNGIGKTTLMQAVVYGLAGGTTEFEKDKNRRWDHTYFRGRLGNSLRSAYVETSFALGEMQVSIRRGFINSRIIALCLDDHDWILDTEQAQSEFCNFIYQYGGYKNEIDFAFLVGRLS